MRGRTMLFAGALALAGLGLASARSRRNPDMPAPTTAERGDDRLDRNDDCERCHVDIAQEWRASLHRASYSDPMVQAAIAGEDDPSFCRSCHAPEADPRAEPDPRRAAIGVGCVGCHLVDQEILAAPRPGPETAPHPIRRDPKFAGPDACAGCHEFWFPSAGRAGHELIMQRTVGEHRRSRVRDQPCQACHMPPTASDGEVHRGHGFHVVGEPRMLRAAATITGSREIDERGRAVVRVILEPRAVGHAFPTGDLHRRLLVRVEAADQRDDRCTAERFLARHFGLTRVGDGSAIRVEVADDRVGLRREPRVVEFVLPGACVEQPLRWSVTYQRVLDTPIGDEQAAKIWDQTEIASQRLEPIN